MKCKMAGVIFTYVFAWVMLLPAQAAKHYEPYYLPTLRPDYAAAMGPPPAAGTNEARRDAEAVRLAEKTRTAAEVKQAQSDDAQEDIFLYATVLGPTFDAAAFPMMAALSAHLRNDVGVTSPPLKALFHRSRPFLADQLHPVCEQKTEGSYPSGHASIGYLTGFVLAQMIPEKAPSILARAGAYAHNRVVCGVHFPSDVEASRTLALVMLGELSTSTRFQQDVRAAEAELQQRGLHQAERTSSNLHQK